MIRQIGGLLRGIRDYLSMILEGDYGKVPRKQREVIGIVMESGNRLVELIKVQNMCSLRLFLTFLLR